MKTRFHTLLEARVLEEIEKIKEDMAQGIGDNLQYWGSVGTIRGLRGALRLCQDIEEDLE